MAATSIEGEAMGVLNSVINQGLTSGSISYAHDLKFGLITAPNTTDDGDTIAINIWNELGMKRILGVKGWRHSTDNSVIVTENPTCTVDNNTLTLTVGGSTDNDSRAYLVVGV